MVRVQLLLLVLSLVLLASTLASLSAAGLLPSANAFRELAITRALGTLTWLPATPLPQAASDGVAFILNDTLYHAGGWAGTPTAPINRLYGASLTNGVPMTWTLRGSVPPDPSGRFEAAGVVYSGRFYLLGGYDGTGILNRIDSYDGTTWRQESNLPRTLLFPAAAVVGNRLYVAGGYDSLTSPPLNQVMFAPIQSGGALGQWQTTMALPQGLQTRLVSRDDCLYVIGGRGTDFGPRAEVYQAVWDTGGAIQSWRPQLPLPDGLALHSVAVRENTLYVMGGELKTGNYSNRVYQSTISSTCTLSEWSVASDLPAARRSTAFAVSTRGIYLIGGQAADGSFVDTVWYDLLPVSTPTPTPTSGPSLYLLKENRPYGPVRLNDTIDYTITYFNTGGVMLTGVVITDIIPANTNLVIGSVSNGGIVTGALITWRIPGGLLPGSSGSVSFQVRVGVNEVGVSSGTRALTYTPDIAPTPDGTPTLTDSYVTTLTMTDTPTPTPTDTPTVTSTHTNTPTVTPTPTGTSTSIPLPDLTVASVGVEPTSPIANERFTVTVIIKNQGLANVGQFFSTGLYVDKAAVGLPDYVLWTPSLSEGMTDSLVCNLSLGVGLHSLTAFVDWNDAIHEAVEDNNKQTISVQAVTPTPTNTATPTYTPTPKPTHTPTGTHTTTPTSTPTIAPTISTVIVRNMAWIYSYETNRWQASNVAANPTYRVYLPIILRRSYE